jgi:GPI mannosyltransferase 3
LVRAYANLNFPHVAWPDEIFQTLEQGHRLVFGFGALPWEFRDGVRNHVFPLFLGLIMKVFGSAPPGDSGQYMVPIQLVMAALGVIPVWVVMAWSRDEGHQRPWLAGVVTASWHELIFFSSEALSEVVAGYSLLAGIYWTVSGARFDNQRRSFVAGIALAISVGLRIQVVPVAVVVVMWSLWTKRRLSRELVSGGLAGLAVFGISDWFAWGVPFVSYWNYFRVNFVENKAAFFGVSPWYEYLTILARSWNVVGVVVLVLVGLSLRRFRLLGTGALLLLLVHSAIAHKEYRFLAPVLILTVAAASLALAQLNASAATNLSWIIAAALLGGSAWRALEYKWAHLSPQEAGWGDVLAWNIRADQIQLYRRLSTDPKICSLASVGLGWAWTGGYTWLHRDVPLIEMMRDGQNSGLNDAYNTVVAPQAFGMRFPQFTQLGCGPHFCAFQREGGCENRTGYNFNDWLKANHM